MTDSEAPAKCWSASCGAVVAADASACAACGSLLRLRSKYRIDGMLGQGGAGVVYRGLDTSLERPVAIKLMHGRIAAVAQKRERFLRECRAMAALDHPGIARIYEADVHHDQLYLVQQLVDGTSLRKSRPFEPSEAIALAADLLAALQHAHEAGICHRDVNPNNVLIVERDDGRRHPILIDFGMARTEDQDATKVAWGGTPRFAAPEQILDPGSNDRRSDLFAVGAIVYEQLSSGRVPYEEVLARDIGKRPREMLAAYDEISKGAVSLVPLSDHVSDAPEHVVTALTRALSVAPEDRFQSAADMAAALTADPEEPTASSGGQPGATTQAIQESTGGADDVEVAALVEDDDAAARDDDGRVASASEARPPKRWPMVAALAVAASLGIYAFTKPDRGDVESRTPVAAVSSDPSPSARPTADAVERPGAAGFVPASFLMPRGIATRDDGAHVIVDRGAHRISVVKDGKVSVLAGSGVEGFADGLAAEARFALPSAVALAPDGAVIVADEGNHRLRRIADGQVSTLAGGFEPGDADGAAAEARFRRPAGVVIDARGAVYVADTGNGRVRLLHDGQVTTLFGGVGLSSPTDLALAADGTLYVVDSIRHQIFSSKGDRLLPVVDLEPGAELLGVEAIASRYGRRHAITTLPDSTLVIADPVARRLWRLREGKLEPMAGTGDAGHKDGYAERATFDSPEGVAADSDAVYIVDAGNAALRELRDGKVATILRGPAGGFADGPRRKAMLHRPWSIAVAPSGALLIADWHNRRVRQVEGDTVTTIAGSGESGHFDGAGLDAQLAAPWGVDVDEDGTVFVADGLNHVVREVKAGRVATLAGSNRPGFADGPAKAARFRAPEDVAAGPDGTVYVADSGNHRIRAIKEGLVTTIAGTGEDGFDSGDAASATFSRPGSVAVSPDGTLYVADTDNHSIRRIHEGRVQTLAGTGEAGYADGQQADAQFEAPVGIAVGDDGRLWVADAGNHCLRVIHNGLVETAAGRTDPGWADGPVAEAAFFLPADVALGRDGRLWVVDAGNHLLRVVVGGEVHTWVGTLQP